MNKNQPIWFLYQSRGFLHESPSFIEYNEDEMRDLAVKCLLSFGYFFDEIEEVKEFPTRDGQYWLRGI